MRRRITGLALGLIGLLAACDGSEGGARGRAEGSRGDRLGEAALPVKAYPVERGEITSYIETHARLQAERWVEVASRAEGIAERLDVDEGDTVRTGQVLARLEKAELSLQVQQARVARDLAQTSFERAEALREREMLSLEEFQNAKNQLESAEVALSQAELRLAYAEIRAPIDGQVMQRLVEVGDLVRVNDVVFAVADLEPLKALIYVPEKRMNQVHPGQQALITVDPVPDRVFPATVRMISPGVDPASGTVKVTLDVLPTNGLLKPGMFASVRLVTDRREDTMIIPKKALVLETDEDDVFVVRDNRAVRVPIEIGYADGDRTEVISGLTSTDRVITVGHEGLKDGAVVRVIGEVDTSSTPSQAVTRDVEDRDHGAERRGRGTAR